MKPLFKIIPILVVLVICGAAALAVSAQEAFAANPVPEQAISDDAVNAIAEKLYCPVCENITLDTCGTAACADWRYELRLQLEAGMSETQIIEDFVRRFGDRVVGTPLDPTLRALSLYTPWIIVAAAIFVGASVFTRRRGNTVALPKVSEKTDQFQDRFEQDVANS